MQEANGDSGKVADEVDGLITPDDSDSDDDMKTSDDDNESADDDGNTPDSETETEDDDEKPKQNGTPKPIEGGFIIKCDEPKCVWSGTYDNENSAFGAYNLHKKKTHGAKMEVPKIKPIKTVSGGGKKKIIKAEPLSPHENEILEGLISAGVPEEKHNMFLKLLRAKAGKMGNWQWHKQCMDDAYITGPAADMYLKYMFPNKRDEFESTDDTLDGFTEGELKRRLKETETEIKRLESEKKLMTLRSSLGLKGGNEEDDKAEDKEYKRRKRRTHPNGEDDLGMMTDKEFQDWRLEYERIWSKHKGGDDDDEDDGKKIQRFDPDTNIPLGKMSDKAWQEWYQTSKAQKLAAAKQNTSSSGGQDDEKSRMMNEILRLRQESLDRKYQDQFDQLQARVGGSDFDKLKVMQQKAKDAGLDVGGKEDRKMEIDMKQLDAKLDILKSQVTAVHSRADKLVEMFAPVAQNRLKKFMIEDGKGPPRLRRYTEDDMKAINDQLTKNKQPQDETDGREVDDDEKREPEPRKKAKGKNHR